MLLDYRTPTAPVPGITPYFYGSGGGAGGPDKPNMFIAWDKDGLWMGAISSIFIP
jgi:hypothetical protein